MLDGVGRNTLKVKPRYLLVRKFSCLIHFVTIGLKVMLAYKFLPPPRIANAKLNKYKDSDKLEIHATITVHNLQHFDPMQHAFDMEFTLDLEWFDSRLKFNNLKYKPKV